MALWGEDVVRRAEAEASTLPPAGAALAQRVAAALRGQPQPSPAAFARWALGLPWGEFAQVVALVSGDARARLLAMEN